MKVHVGGGDPQAHLHRREDPTCDLCGESLKGAMPLPLWVAPSDGKDEQGHPLPNESSVIRMYFCKTHRDELNAAMLKAGRRERNRSLKGQRMYPEINKLTAIKNPIDEQ